MSAAVQIPTGSTYTAPSSYSVKPLSGTAAQTSPSQRAAAEKLVAYPVPFNMHLWECNGHTITLTGPEPSDVHCDCPDSVLRHRTCKHGETVAFYRREGLRPIKPAAPSVPQAEQVTSRYTAAWFAAEQARTDAVNAQVDALFRH